MRSRQTRNVRRTTLLLAVLAAAAATAACSGDRATAPPGDASLDAVRAQADVAALQGAIGGPALRSFGVLSQQFVVVPGAGLALLGFAVVLGGWHDDT